MSGVHRRLEDIPPTLRPASSKPSSPHRRPDEAVLRLQRQAGNAAVSRLVQAGRDRDGGGAVLRRTPARLQRQPTQVPPAATDATSVDFTAAFNKYAGAYPTLALRQNNAIDSAYTEAKKPKKPDLAEDLLTALAIAAIGIPISLMGSRIGAAIESQLLTHVADPGTTENAVLKAAYRQAQDEMKMIARSINDGFKDGAKKLVGDKVKEKLKSGKLPVDAFFEAQKDAVVKAAEDARLKAEDQRVLVSRLSTIHPQAPLWIARGLAIAIHEQFDAAYDLQQTQTIEHWLSYQAEQTVGHHEVRTTCGDTQVVTILHNVVERGDYQGTGTKRLEDATGILFVDAFVEAATDDAWTVFANKGHLAGLSKGMIGMLSQPIRELDLPVVYRISSLYHKDGLGNPDLTQSLWPGPYAFNIGVNEVGETWRSRRYPWQRKAVEKCGGEEKILNQLNLYTLTELKVEPDREAMADSK